MRLAAGINSIQSHLKSVKYLILLIVFIIVSCSQSVTVRPQDIQQSLKKYSYFIIGFKPVGNGILETASGTGYFIRDNNRLYFLTAKHVLTPCDYIDTCTPPVRRNSFPDSMSILLNDERGML